MSKTQSPMSGASGGPRADTVTLLMTDIEGSTRLWEERPTAMRAVLALHDAMAEATITANGGRLIKTRGEGDSLFAVFPDAAKACEAAIEMQRSFSGLHQAAGAEGLPELRVRMALQTGEPEVRDGDYFGPVVNRCARVRGLGRGGQILVTEATATALSSALPSGAVLMDHGVHRLRDLSEPEHVFELWHPSLGGEAAPLMPMGSVPNNLPTAVTAFIGRVRELADVRDLCLRSRATTLVGPGGCGKTRLALEAAIEVGVKFDGVWLVELAELRDEALVAQALAATLGVAERPDTELIAQIVNHLRLSATLLIFDGCEHLVDGVAVLADRLLRACPRLTVLATSREPLSITGEATYRVLGLPLPEAGRTPHSGSPDAASERITAAQAAANEAVRLFCDRARSASPSFGLTDATAPSVVAICRQLDGIPLAIELAAARARVLPVEQIAARLNDRFGFLDARSRGSHPHHQTLRRLFDWSYDLLNFREQTLLRRLSVFVGGWRLEACQAVCVDCGSDVTEVLTSLADKSWVIFEDNAERARMLETVRQYAETRLRESGEEERARAAHARYFVSVAEGAAPGMVGPEEGACLALLDADYGNLRATMIRCAETPDQVTDGLRIARALHLFWSERGMFSEGRARCDALLAAASSEPSSLRCAVEIVRAEMALRQGDHEAVTRSLDACVRDAATLGDASVLSHAYYWRGLSARDRRDYASATHNYARSLELAAPIGDRALGVLIRMAIGVVAFEQGALEEARERFRESLADARDTGSPSLMVRALGNLGCVAEMRGDDEEAQAYYEEALDRARAVGNRHFVATSLLNLGETVARRGEPGRALGLLQEAYGLARDMQYPQRLAESIEAMARLADATGRRKHAARLLGAAQGVRSVVGCARAPHEAPTVDQMTRGIRAALGAVAFDAEFELGREACASRAAMDALVGERGDAE